jgi:phage terminase small subunit
MGQEAYMRSDQDTVEFLRALGIECRIGDEVYELMVDANPTVKAFIEGEISLHEALFVEFYLANGFNATRAAKSAGYAGLKAGVHGRVGQKVRNRPKVRDLIAKRIADKALNADEVLAEWAEIAKADMTDFITITEVPHPLSEEMVNVAVPDMAKAAERGKLHLVKKCKMDVNGTFHLELRDQDAALEKIARHLGLFEKDNTLNLPKGLVELLSSSPEERHKALKNYQKMLESDN